MGFENSADRRKQAGIYPDTCWIANEIKANERCLPLFRQLPNVGIQNFGMWGMYNLAKAYRSIKKSIAIRRVEDWEASNGHIKVTTRLFHGPWHDPVGEHISAQPFRMWNTLRFHPFLEVWQIFERRRSDANKQDFENNLNLTYQAQCTPKTMGILTQVFYTYGPNLVIRAWTGVELSRGQTWWRTDGRTDGLTDRRTQATTIPVGQYWPRVMTFHMSVAALGIEFVYRVQITCQLSSS